MCWWLSVVVLFFFSSRRRHTRCALVTGVQTCALPIYQGLRLVLTALRRTPGALPEALMAELEGDRERGLLAALLVEDRKWGDTHSHVAELKRRYHKIGRASCRERVCQYV